jgi:D-alanyl-D-alanine carboxypeptidase
MSCVIGITVLIGLGVIIYLDKKTLSSGEVVTKINSLVHQAVSKNSTISSGLVKVNSSDYNFNETFVFGMENGKPVKDDQQFHVASVGKSFTATLFGILIERKQVWLTDPISKYLDQEVLEGLFEIEGVDYSDRVTIKHLLNHTSGIADYFEDKKRDGTRITNDIIKNPDRVYKPKDLIDFTRNEMQAVSRPGEVFHYSDSGYILLGLILEKVTGESFATLLHKEIFTPFSMKDTYLSFYSKAQSGRNQMADIWIEETEVSDYNAISLDWSGGGIVSTLDDLDRFIRTLNNGDILSMDTLEKLYSFDHKFMRGIHYGLGFMEYHFGEFFPTLKSLKKYRGHMGILGTHMIYNKESDTSIIMSFGSSDYPAGSFRLLIKILGYLKKLEA